MAVRSALFWRIKIYNTVSFLKVEPVCMYLHTGSFRFAARSIRTMRILAIFVLH